MAEIRLFKLGLSPSDFSYTTTWRSSTWGGSDTPNADYPEFGEMENVHRAEAAGASGQDVIDATNTADYTTSWITLCGIGPLANGQFDCRGAGAGHPFKCRWKQYFKSSALAEAGISVPFTLAHGGVGGTGPGLFSSNVFLQVSMIRTSGANFAWQAKYLKPGGGVYALQSVSGSADVSDNAEHLMIVTIVPSTITGAITSVASDGSFDVTVDGVSMVSGSALQFVINQFATTNPAVYYGKTIWHGD